MIEEVRFKADGISLVGLIHAPEGKGPLPGIVVCHPHPLYGGSMDSPLIKTVCNALMTKSFVSLRFNFRGVEGSEGEFDNGIGEIKDVEAAISYLASVKSIDPNKIGLTGYSAGAAWGMAAGYKDNRIKAMAAISPALTMFDFNFLENYLLPLFLVSGGNDNFVPLRAFRDLCNKLKCPKECLTIQNADHFWFGDESKIAEKVAGFFVKYLH
jgi:uncharacterized protein